MPTAVFGLGWDLRDFVENDNDYSACDDDVELQHERCAKIEAEMR